MKRVRSTDEINSDVTDQGLAGDSGSELLPNRSKSKRSKCRQRATPKQLSAIDAAISQVIADSQDESDESEPTVDSHTQTSDLVPPSNSLFATSSEYELINEVKSQRKTIESLHCKIVFLM